MKPVQRESVKRHQAVGVSGGDGLGKIQIGGKGKVRSGEGLAQDLERREGQNDVSERSRMDNQNFHYSMTMVFMLF
jgi:hypothetical protein